MQCKVKLFLNKYLYQRRFIVLSKDEISWGFLTRSAFHKNTFYYRSIYYARFLLLNPILNRIQLMFCLGVVVSYQPLSYLQLLESPRLLLLLFGCFL